LFVLNVLAVVAGQGVAHILIVVNVQLVAGSGLCKNCYEAWSVDKVDGAL